MAVAAEMYGHSEDIAGGLYEADEWVEAQVVADLYKVREQSDHEAAALFEARMDHLREGNWEAVPFAIDPLTTAAMAVEALEEHGPYSDEYREKRAGLELDCQRLFAEAHRKLSWEYFANLSQDFDHRSKGYVSHGRELIDIVRDGVTPMLEGEESARRIAEFREEMTYRAIGRSMVAHELEDASEIVTSQPLFGSEASAAISVHTISECPDWAIQDLEDNPKRQHGGYAPEIQKLMIRVVHFDPETGNRQEEQLGLPGVYITHDVVTRALVLLGAAHADEQLSKTDVLGRQLINKQDRGALDMARLLDEIASEEAGQTICMGEVVAVEQSRNYESIPAEAAARQAKQHQDAAELADYLMRLAGEGAAAAFAELQVTNFVTDRVFAAVKSNPEEVKIAFDDTTAEVLSEAAYRRSIGDHMTAERLENEARTIAPQASFCGAGSCGIEGVSVTSTDGARAKSLGLSDDKGELLRDTIRRCPGCKKTRVFYDMKGGKVCLGCGNSNLGGKSSGAPK